MSDTCLEIPIGFAYRSYSRYRKRTEMKEDAL